MPRRVLLFTSLALSLVAPVQSQEDPVMRARIQRASALGIPEGDLPPVPRSIIEPPPLPPPEAHVKDTRGGKRAKGRTSKGKPGKKKAAARRTKKPAAGKKK